MKLRPLKVTITVIVVSALFLLLFKYYIPSKIDASSIKRVERRVKAPTNRSSTLIGTAEIKKSIANELGVPEPTEITYREFNPDQIKKQKRQIRKKFQVPEEIIAEVGFWKDIYTKYDKTKVVFHDKKYLDVIYSVLDISNIINNKSITDEEKWRERKKIVSKEYSKIRSLLKNVENKKYSELTPEEKGIYHLYDHITDSNKFKNIADSERLRSQTGIKDKFLKGIKRAGRYLGEIEYIFRKYGVPLEITRLVFVESMFNLKAVSKVGASGIWQFMPSTGRLFLNIDQIVDERNDPIKATHAAAKHLLRDYKILKSWPLAINSYNSGRVRLERAVKKLGTKNIGRIIKEFEYPGYGFASRNFYPAFLAALDAFENRDKYFDKIEMDKPLEFDFITTPYSATMSNLAEYTGIPVKTLEFLNPHFQSEVKSGDLPIPAGFKLRVPKNHGEDFLIAFYEMNQLPKYAKWHIVEKGENLRTIASKYSTSAQKIKHINGLRRSRLKTGQIIKLPQNISLAKE